jgi:hypothetical protein
VTGGWTGRVQVVCQPKRSSARRWRRVLARSEEAAPKRRRRVFWRRGSSSRYQPQQQVPAPAAAGTSPSITANSIPLCTTRGVSSGAATEPEKGTVTSSILSGGTASSSSAAAAAAAVYPSIQVIGPCLCGPDGCDDGEPATEAATNDGHCRRHERQRKQERGQRTRSGKDGCRCKKAAAAAATKHRTAPTRISSRTCSPPSAAATKATSFDLAAVRELAGSCYRKSEGHFELQISPSYGFK